MSTDTKKAPQVWRLIGDAPDQTAPLQGPKKP